MNIRNARINVCMYKQDKHSQTQTTVWGLPEGKEGGGIVKGREG